MRTITLFLCALFILVSFTGCAYVDTRSPYDKTLNNTEIGSKVGRSHNYSLFWLAVWGDGGYAAAAKDGDISIMKHSDVEVYSLLFGLYVRRTIVVYGD